MKSLVEELRAGAELEEAYDADGIIHTGYQLSLRWRAAAEIERLRGLLVDGIELAECTSPYVHGTAIRRREWAARVRKALGE